MSRFWAGDDSGSSSAESDSGSESEQEKKVQTNRWAAVSDSDSSDEGERVVRSAKDKAWDGMKAVVSKISNARKINDWHEIQTQFDLLNKQVDKAKTHIQKEGAISASCGAFTSLIRLVAIARGRGSFLL